MLNIGQRKSGETFMMAGGQSQGTINSSVIPNNAPSTATTYGMPIAVSSLFKGTGLVQICGMLWCGIFVLAFSYDLYYIAFLLRW